MKTFTLLLVMVFIGGRMVGQNLVPNGDFENYIVCPTALDQVYNCVGWSSVSYSPDYLNTCSSSSQVSIPYNFAGYQNPYSGNAYCAVIPYCCLGLCDSYRELIQAQLNSSMTIGTEYFISMYAVAGFNTTHTIDLATNKLGVRFSTISYDPAHPPPINNWAHFYSDSVIVDTVNWIHLQGSFIADSSYQYIIIGSFFDDQNISIVRIGQDSSRAYDYIDDVCVSQNPNADCSIGVSTGNLISNSIFQLSPNPFTTHLQLHYTLTQPGELMVYDALGRKVKSCALAASQKTFELSVGELPSGVYLVAVNSGGLVFVKKVVKE